VKPLGSTPAPCAASGRPHIKLSLAQLAEYRFEGVLAGHSSSARLPVDDMHERLRALVERM